MNKEWLQKARIRWLIGATAAALVLGIFAWWFLFHPYVSTNDARIAANILRVSPVGVGGQIEKVLVEEGAFVKAGDVLVEIDHRIPRANLVKAQSRYELAKIELGRIRSLAANQYTAKRELDNAQNNFNVAEAELNLAQITYDNTYLKSPVDGVVIQKLAEEGNLLEPGQVAVVISDVDHAWVSANIEETNVAKVRLGQKVSVAIDEGGTLTGTVEEVTAAAASQFSLLPAENASGNFTKVVQRIPVKIALDPHPGHRILRVGQSVTIKIKVR